MKISFTPLATLAVAHSYYAGDCRDFEFVPTAHTRALLGVGRLMSRMKDGRLNLLYEADDTGAPICSLAGLTLWFGMRLQNPGLENSTEPVLSDPSLTPYYSNTTIESALDSAQGVLRIAGRYTHEPLLATRPVKLTLSDSANNSIDTRTVAEAIASYDLRSQPPGVYALREDYDGGQIRTRNFLVDAELRDPSIWGVIALRIGASHYQSPASFVVNLQARAETLRYYFVAKNWSAAEFSKLAVEDAGFLDDARPEILFEKKSAPFSADSGLLSPGLLGESGDQIAVFQSKTFVARRERGARKLRLKHDSAVLIEHLPSPSPERPKADMIVHLSKP